MNRSSIHLHQQASSIYTSRLPANHDANVDGGSGLNIDTKEGQATDSTAPLQLLPVEIYFSTANCRLLAPRLK